MYIVYVIKLYVYDIIGTYNIYMIYSTILSVFLYILYNFCTFFSTLLYVFRPFKSCTFCTLSLFSCIFCTLQSVLKSSHTAIRYLKIKTCFLILNSPYEKPPGRKFHLIICIKIYFFYFYQIWYVTYRDANAQLLCLWVRFLWYEPTFLKLDSLSPGVVLIPIINSNLLNQIKKKKI